MAEVVRVLDGPVKWDGVALRAVELADGSGRTELWGGPERGWEPGGDVYPLMVNPEASADFLASLGVPERDWPPSARASRSA